MLYQCQPASAPTTVRCQCVYSGIRHEGFDHTIAEQRSFATVLEDVDSSFNSETRKKIMDTQLTRDPLSITRADQHQSVQRLLAMRQESRTSTSLDGVGELVEWRNSTNLNLMQDGPSLGNITAVHQAADFNLLTVCSKAH